MRIIISPAKKMNADDGLQWRDLPAFLPKAQTIMGALRQMGRDELKALWKCSDKITDENIERLADMDLESGLTPAILAYEGIQYRYMAPGVFTGDEFEYVQARLRILSGFYGVLRPFDGIRPYRLEMQAKLSVGGAKDLYGYWGSDIARAVFEGTDCVLNLASKEYSRCVSSFMPKGARMITCVFGEEIGGKVMEKGTMCKMARGEMVRFLAEQGAAVPEDAKAFDRHGYRFAPEKSDEANYVFIRCGTAKQRTGEF